METTFNTPRMRHLTITKAITTPVGPDDLTIEFAGSPPPSHATSLKQAANFYQFEADLLSDALINTLPGGTVDALLRKLLEYRASLLAVPFFTQPANAESQQGQQVPPDVASLLDQLTDHFQAAQQFITKLSQNDYTKLQGYLRATRPSHPHGPLLHFWRRVLNACPDCGVSPSQLHRKDCPRHIPF